MQNCLCASAHVLLSFKIYVCKCIKPKPVYLYKFPLKTCINKRSNLHAHTHAHTHGQLKALPTWSEHGAQWRQAALTAMRIYSTRRSDRWTLQMKSAELCVWRRRRRDRAWGVANNRNCTAAAEKSARSLSKYYWSVCVWLFLLVWVSVWPSLADMLHLWKIVDRRVGVCDGWRCFIFCICKRLIAELSNYWFVWRHF